VTILILYENETFYFHRINGKGFKEGTYKGMDITFGKPGLARAYLVRAIKCVESGEIVEGPCLVVQTILKIMTPTITKVKDFHQLYTNKNPKLSIHDVASELFMRPKEAWQINLSCSPRVGLKYKSIKGYTDETVLKYCMGPYRFIVDTVKIKKQQSTIKMARDKTSYLSAREAGSKITIDQLPYGLASWKVADIARCYGCYESL